ncbi:MAG: elongation factor P [Ktedonobacteraceae bacterium]|nr:elongation factor P [Ktedonobacteraceae bacterium]
MISSNEIQKGLSLDIDGEQYTVLEWQHVGKARGSANIRLKLRHLRTREIIERTLDAGHKFRVVPVVRRPAIFMYWDGEFYHFMLMDTESQEEIIVSPQIAGEARKYIVDNLQVNLLLLNGEPVTIELPESVVMRVKEVEMPKVGTASHYRHATVEGPAHTDSNLSVLVPQFISAGDLIRVNTSTGEYIERV